MQPKQLVAHIREALATDGRTNLLDVTVKVAGSRAFLIGEVGSSALKAAAAEVAAEVLPPGVELVDELWVASYGEPGKPETLR